MVDLRPTLIVGVALEAHSKPLHGWIVGFGDSLKGEEGEKGENSSKEGDSPNLSTLSGSQTLLTSPL